MPLTFSYITDILSMFTRVIDIMTVSVIAISAFQALITILKQRLFIFSNYERASTQGSNKNQTDTVVKNFIKGLLLALEFESANAIIKMGMFTASITTENSLASNFNDFAFFVGILLLRIVINQSLRRFSIAK